MTHKELVVGGGGGVVRGGSTCGRKVNKYYITNSHFKAVHLSIL